MQKAAVRFPLLILATLALHACASSRGLLLPDFPDWESRRAALSSADRWEFTGRIGVSAGVEGFNGKLRWSQDGEGFRATVSGPLGTGSVRIEGNAKIVTVTDKKGEATELEDPEIDLRLRYGWTIPVTSLRYWALGIPDPSQPAESEFGEDGLIQRIEQRDWVVTISQYRDGGGQPMPRRLSARNDDAKVRLVIDKWTFY
jgi:outer membrane lipoprotein LolB